MATSIPASAFPREFSPYDKVAHFSMYAVFGALLLRYLLEGAMLKAAALSIVIGVSFAAIDEWHQRFIPGRSSEMADWMADAAGAAFGAAAWAAFHWRRTQTAAPQ